MVNIIKPIPGGDLGTWGTKNNTALETLAGALTETEADAADAQTAAGTAVATAATAQAAANTAHSAATAASTAATAAAMAATAAATAVSTHASAADPHPQYLTPARADLRYTRLAGIPQTGTPPEPLFVAAQGPTGVSFSLSYSPYGLRTDGTTYYDPAGVPASDRAYPAVQPDGTVRLVKLGVGSASTGDVTPPTLGGFAANSITSVSASVTCTSNEAATAVVQYGTTTSYGSQAAAIGSGTGFAVPITGLTASTLYHYRWRVTDLAGNLTVSADQTFTTAAAGAANATLANFTPTAIGTESVSMFAADLSSANHWVEADCVFGGSGNGVAVILRGNSSGSQGIRLAVNNSGNWHIFNGVTELDTGTFTGAGTGGRIRGEVTGTSVSFWWNGALVATRDLGSAISALATNKRPGVGIYLDTTTGASMSNIVANVSAGSTPPPDNGGSGPGSGSPGAKAYALFGTTRSGLPWHSGAWVTSSMSTANADGFGSWRGAPLDFYTVYPGYNTWSEMNSSEWVEQLTSGFAGRLNFGLPMLPKDRVGAWSDVTSGSYDYVFTKLANDLKNANRASSMIRVGLECNGNWFPWSVTWNTNTQFIAAFQRIVGLFRAVSPSFKFAYCWNIYTQPQGMPSGTSQQGQLDRFYPGDSYVDCIELDFYDFDNVVAQNDSQWAYAKNPLPGVGLEAITAYARAHGKGVWIGEWGCHSVTGPGDNAFFIRKVWEYFVSIADILVGENYFSEPASYIANGIGFPTNQLPNAAIAYKNRFGRPDLYPTGTTP